MPKIALIGAGSTVFAKRLIGDILLTPELAEDAQMLCMILILKDLVLQRLLLEELWKNLD